MPRKTKPTPWQCRIIGEGMENPEQLLANPHNFRVHSLEQGNALEGGLNVIGWIQRVIVNRRTGHLIDGHLRVQRSLRRGEAQIPVTYVDLDEHEERIALATLDPIAAMAQTDEEQLALLLSGIDPLDSDLAAFLDDLMPEEKQPGGGAAPKPEARTAWGELINLGNHRLMCGDLEDEAHCITLTSGNPDATIRDLSDLAVWVLTQARNPAQMFVMSDDAFACDALVDAWEAAAGKACERILPQG